MKTKRTNRITALVLALVMLASVFALPAYAVEEEEKEPLVFADVNFEDVAVNEVDAPLPEDAPEDAVPDKVPGTSITATGVKSAHTYASIAEDDVHGKYITIPFRGLTEDGKSGTGNFDKVLTVQHPEVSYETTQGVIIELDFFAKYVPIEGASMPTVEFQLRSINHDKDATNQDKTSSNFISFGQLNLSTGEFSTSAAKLDAPGVKLNEWNNIRFELDLANAIFDIYVNGEKYATYGKIANGGDPKNIVVPAGTLLIAKCNKNKGAYNPAEPSAVPDTDMTHVAVDNIKFYENVDFVPPEVEPDVLYSIFNDSYQSKAVGMSPKLFGYSAPSSAVVAPDPTNSSNNAVKVDLAARASGDYYLWFSANNFKEKINPNADYNPEDPENFPQYTIVDGKLTATTTKGTFTAPIWGDDEEEMDKSPAFECAIQELAGVQEKGKSGSWYFVTSAMADALHGVENVASGLLVKNHPTILSADHEKVVLNVDYYFSEDATGKIEIQLQGYFKKKDDVEGKTLSALTWIDTVTIQGLKDDDLLKVGTGSNYEFVCGSAPLLKKGEWFTMSVVFDMATGWEDIYFNGSYCYTMKPRTSYMIGSEEVSETDFCFHSIAAGKLSVGKIQRNTTPAALNGYFMIDNVNFSTGETLQGEQYEKNFKWNFDGIAPGTTDFADTGFEYNIPSSVVLAGDALHTSALKLEIGEPIDAALASRPVLYRMGATATDAFYLVAKVYDDKNQSVLLAKDLADGEEAPAEIPENAIKGTRGKYTVDGTSGFILGTYKDYVNYWAKLEDGTAAKNINTQWTFHNPGISYATKTRVATDVEIFIPEGASGRITSQIVKGAGTDPNGEKADFNYKELYTLDLATGNINLGAGVSDDEKMGTLKIGEWNNVSFAVNMLTGVTELYVNNFFVGEGNIGYTQVAFYENTWILAKVARKQDQTESPLAGYMMIDDARFFTVTNQMITVDSNLENVTEVTFAGEIVPDGTKLFITEDVPYVETKFDTSDYVDVVAPGYSDDYLVSVRTNKPIGLRFTTEVDEGLLEELLAEHPGKVTYGTIIVPSSAIATVETVTRPELQLRQIEYLEVRTDSFFRNEFMEDNGIYLESGYFAGSIVGLKEGNLTRDFSAFGYVEIALESGGSIVIYTEEMTANLQVYAQTFLDEIDEIPDDMRVVLEAFAIGRYPLGYEKDY